MEKDKKYISFEIHEPLNIPECEFFSLVYRLDKLNTQRYGTMTAMEVHDNNRNIQEMQEILEHFKIHLIEGEE